MHDLTTTFVSLSAGTLSEELNNKLSESLMLSKRIKLKCLIVQSKRFHVQAFEMTVLIATS